MAKSDLILKRFKELDAQADEVHKTRRYEQSEFSSGHCVDSTLLLTWQVKVRNLLKLSCGQDSEHYAQFVASEQPMPYRTNADTFANLRAVFNAAREDYEGGYINTLRNLVQAEVFDSELEQAKELARAGYHTAAAVIAGTVLETTLRQMCLSNGITFGGQTAKLDRMNSELAKAGVYNLLRQKRITALADIRNNAAHGKPEQFGAADVDTMIADVEKFIADHL